MNISHLVAIFADAGPDREVGAGVLEMLNLGDPPPCIADWQVTAEGAEVLLDCSDSHAFVGGTIISYEWSCSYIDDNSDSHEHSISSSDALSEILLPVGVHTVTLTIEDDLGKIDTDDVEITVLEAIPGDINNDDSVDLADFVILRNHFGESR